MLVLLISALLCGCQLWPKLSETVTPPPSMATVSTPDLEALQSVELQKSFDYALLAYTRDVDRVRQNNLALHLLQMQRSEAQLLYAQAALTQVLGKPYRLNERSRYFLEQQNQQLAHTASLYNAIKATRAQLDKTQKALTTERAQAKQLAGEKELLEQELAELQIKIEALKSLETDQQANPYE